MTFKKDSFINEFFQNFFIFVLLPYTLLLSAVIFFAYISISSAAFAEIANYVYGFCAFSFIFMAAGAFFLGSSVTRPIKALSNIARELSKGNTSVKIDDTRHDEIGELQKSFINFSKLFNEREKMKSTFSRYISDYIADEVLTENIGQTLADYRNVTILFSDIRGFTTVSETIEPKDLFNILNMYFDQMIDIVLKNRGVINKFIGDAMMVLYNAPTLCENAEIMAIITGLEMNRNLRDFNNKFTKKYGIGIEIGIGINSGQVIAGNIGSEKRMEYTVIGDNVNVSSRLQTIAKGGEIVISESVAR
ncbi:MAG TPA: adenylate/guanylate cyclase domain-containing protein, partial [Candidatus Wallbacteria bacterium]|nr:adenylate/guanylate cyclase domain-containing protein [Candidatus Wallbacteria bacterium]